MEENLLLGDITRYKKKNAKEKLKKIWQSKIEQSRRTTVDKTRLNNGKIFSQHVRLVQYIQKKVYL